MSSFKCEKCGEDIIDSGNGYITECRHYPKTGGGYILFGEFNTPEEAIEEWNKFAGQSTEKGENMNIYLLNEDSNVFCIKATSMAEAVGVCEKSYLDDIIEENHYDKLDKDAIESERKYYHEQILQSCSLVGELRN